MIATQAEIDVPRLRQGVYRFFAVAFSPPGQSGIDKMREAAELLEDLGVGAFAFAEPWLDMRLSLARYSDLEELAARYVHLFESGTDGALCPPVESFYASSAREGGPAVVTAELEAHFAKVGFTPVGKTDHGADHVSAQLELMALLCAQEATAREHGDLASVCDRSHDELEFLDMHLGRWLPRFAARIDETRAHGFYREVVVAADAFVGHDRELLHLLARKDRTGEPS